MSETTHAEVPAECLERGIFAARGEVFTLRQVLGAGEYLGLAHELWGWLDDDCLVCETYAAEEGFEEEAEGLQAALDEFRYGRRLVSAEETERWLAERQLSEEELIDALVRERWRQRFQGELASIRGGYAPPPGAVAEALWPALVVHGRLGPLAVALARRLLAAELLPAGEAPAGGVPAGETPAGERAASRGCPPWARCSPEWRRRLLDLEGVYRAVLGSLLAPRHLEAALVSRRLDLTRFRLLAARCATLDVAREALLCVTQDGESFQQATARAAASREDRVLFLEDAPEPLVPYLVSAVPGESFLLEEEEEQGGEPLLVHVAEKGSPGLEDVEVRRRLESSLLARSYGPLIDERVRWLSPLE